MTVPTAPTVRAGDHDRETTANQLGQALAQGYLAMVVIVLSVWLAVGFGAGAWYFWPIWPILGAGIGVIGHALPVRFAMPAPCHQRHGSIRPARIA